MEIEAFILIGGRSSRFGCDKAFAEVGGHTLAERSLTTVRVSGISSRVTFVAGSETQFAIESIMLDAPFIFDLYADRGPLGGLHAALSYAQTPWIFVLACDYPGVTAAMIALLAGKIPDPYGAVLPEQADKRPQPLCAFYNVETALPLVETTIQRPRVPPPLRETVAELSPRIVTYSEYSHLPNAAEMFLNVNTPHDLERAIKSDANISA